jgi:hypothetical protein
MAATGLPEAYLRRQATAQPRASLRQLTTAACRPRFAALCECADHESQDISHEDVGAGPSPGMTGAVDRGHVTKKRRPGEPERRRVKEGMKRVLPDPPGQRCDVDHPGRLWDRSIIVPAAVAIVPVMVVPSAIVVRITLSPVVVHRLNEATIRSVRAVRSHGYHWCSLRLMDRISTQNSSETQGSK